MDYGTIGLAKDILRLFKDSDVYEKRIIIMAGDRAGTMGSWAIRTTACRRRHDSHPALQGLGQAGAQGALAVP